MRRLLPFLTVLALAALLCSPADAQRRMRTRVVSAPPGTQVITTSPSGSTNNSVPVTVVNPAGAVSGNSVDQLLNGYPAPGLGFDYTHYAAVNRHQGVRALIDPITQHRLALERQIRRETPRGFGAVAPAFPVVVNSIVVNVTPQPPVVIIQEPEPEPEPAERIERSRYIEERAAPAPPAVFYEPAEETRELVFIRRDGSLIFAVAYTVRGADAAGQPARPGADTSADGARLIYITREGYRRSIPLAELDLPATRDMNDARGSTLHLQ